MTDTTGVCARCGESRPVTPWLKNHAHMSEPDSWGCPFCGTVPLPPFCDLCTTAERAAEAEYFATVPRSLSERTARALFHAHADIEEQRKAS